jgi:predicted enzyme related to lactoylglutathione lyase
LGRGGRERPYAWPERARALRSPGRRRPVVTFQPKESLEETLDDLKDQGVEIPADISDHPWGRVATFKDSEGNDIQLYEAPKN